MVAGRPMKWKTAEEIKPMIDKFFLETPKDEWTITGLALALDTSRLTLIEYCERAERGEVDIEFINTIRKAKEQVEHSYEIDLKKSGRTGTIFALKNFDWKDKSEVESSNVNYNKDITNISDEELDKIING